MSGISFPMSKDALIQYVKANGARTGVSEDAVEVVRQLPDRIYDDMADLENGLAQIKE